MKKIIFLCTGNSCRSQMAEGFAKKFGKGIIEAHSAGLLPAGVNANAIKVMRGFRSAQKRGCNKTSPVLTRE